jgi:hypothetical protein
MPQELPFELRLTLSKRFPSGTAAVELGRYQVRPIPTSSIDGEAVLSFMDTYEAPIGGGSHPEEEATMVARCLSLCLDARLKKGGIRVNHIDISDPPHRERQVYPQFYGVCDPSSLGRHLAVFGSLPDDLARQYSRAASTYSFALEFIPADPTFAFFLLVVAVECLSSQDAVIPYAELDPHKKCERFCAFVKRMLPDLVKGPDERDDDLSTHLLKTVYYSHRSAFVHGGREVSVASVLADRAGSSYLKHLVDGKETKTPGLAWFAKVVRGSLLGYLESVPPEALNSDEHRLSRLAFEKAGLQLKAKRDMTAGELATFDDIEFR